MKKKVLIIVGIAIVIIATVIILFFTVFKKNKYDVNVGEIVQIGKYEQDGDTSNGIEDISWVVIAKEGDKELLLSLKAIENIPYDSAEKETTWETSFIRKWLNETFLNDYFDQDEKEIISNSTIETIQCTESSNYISLGGNTNNTNSSGKQREMTTDRLFLLGKDEFDTYVANTDLINCEATTYVKNNGILPQKEQFCTWRLRDYYSSKVSFQNYGIISGSGGVKTYFSYCVNYRGEYGDDVVEAVSSKDVTIRPAMWISIK